MKRTSYLWLILAGFVHAENPPAEQPLRIIADEMDCDQKTNVCTATGNAFAQKMNDPKKQTISADKLVAYFKKKDKSEASDESKKTDETQAIAGNTSLEKLEAFGNVVLADNDSIIKCDRGVYYTDSETADFYENVSVTQGKNELTGDYGHADMKSQTYTVQKKQGRVEGLFYQKESNPTKTKTNNQ